MVLRSIGVGVVAAVCFWACSGPETKPAGPEAKQAGPVQETIEHEKCSGAKTEAIDANNDGKPDVTKVYDGKGHEICRVSDLNHDGKPEMTEYFDENGNMRRRELNFESSEAVSAVELYEGGKLVKRELDTTGQRRVDTWDYYDPATGKRTKRERDTNNDGHVDQWWTFNADGTIAIANDKNGDGRPDPESVITINANGSIFVPDAGAPANASSSDAGGVAPPPPPPVMMMDDDAGALMDAGTGKKKPAGGAKKGNK